MRVFETWVPQGNLDSIYDIENIELNDGLKVYLMPDGLRRDSLQGQKIVLHWDNFLCFQVSDESYREECWASDRENVWTFYVSADSPYLQAYKERSVLFPDKALHFLLVGTNLIVDVLALAFPQVVITKE